LVTKNAEKRKINIKNLMLSLFILFCIFWILTPVVHETGHAIAGLLMGEELEEFHLPTSVLDHPYAKFKSSETLQEKIGKIAIFGAGVTIPLGYLFFFIKGKIINKNQIIDFIFAWQLFSFLVVEPIYQILPDIMNLISGKLLFISDLRIISSSFGISMLVLYYMFAFQSIVGLKIIWRLIRTSTLNFIYIKSFVSGK